MKYKPEIINLAKSILALLLEQISAAQSSEEAREIATKQFSAANMIKCSDNIIENNLHSLVNTAPEDIYDGTHALAIAISLADVDACEKILKHFDKDSINDPNIFVRGYRQYYTPFHHALDPNGHLKKVGECNLYLIQNTSSIETRDNLIAIIKLLTQVKADPNLMVYDSSYLNPAIAAGYPGSTHLEKEIVTSLRVELILAGADPYKGGSSFYTTDTSDYPLSKFLDAAFKRFNEADPVEQQKLSGVLSDSVNKNFEGRYTKLVEMLSNSRNRPDVGDSDNQPNVDASKSSPRFF